MVLLLLLLLLFLMLLLFLFLLLFLLLLLLLFLLLLLLLLCCQFVPFGSLCLALPPAQLRGFGGWPAVFYFCALGSSMTGLPVSGQFHCFWSRQGTFLVAYTSRVA